MKANELPEKIYIDSFSCFAIESNRKDIEYIRTDAFIEKACKYLFENYHGEKLSLRMIEDFKNYMKGE